MPLRERPPSTGGRTQRRETGERARSKAPPRFLPSAQLRWKRRGAVRRRRKHSSPLRRRRVFTSMRDCLVPVWHHSRWTVHRLGEPADTSVQLVSRCFQITEDTFCTRGYHLNHMIQRVFREFRVMVKSPVRHRISPNKEVAAAAPPPPGFPISPFSVAFYSTASETGDETPEFG